jgi:16S rRNA pseudouridine516 synthase
MSPRRIDQILSSHGYCSRSDARYWVKGGRVLVNGVPAKAHDAKADPLALLIDGEPVECPNGLLAVFHKPAGCVCSHDERDGPTIYDVLPKRWPERNPPTTSIGRLDKDTTGVLLLTDNGALVQRWTSPKHKVPKVYEVTVEADLRPELVELFASGTLHLDKEDKPCQPARLEIVSAREARLELTEGKYHQVKRMFGSQGCPVTKLHRSRFGDYTVEGLAPGEWKLVPLPAVGA